MYEPYKTGRRHPHRPQSQPRRRHVNPITPPHGPRISIPSQYQAPVTSIRSQGGYPICWAFGATSAVEANVLRKTQGTAQPNGNSAGSATILPYGGISPNVSSTQPDYSEVNLVYSVFNTYAGKNDAFSLNYGGVGNSYKKYHGYNNGGNWGETAATLAGWYGETDEVLNPYQTEFSAANADAMYQRGVSTAGQSQLHVSDIEELPAPYSAASRRTTARLTTISWKAAAYRTTT